MEKKTLICRCAAEVFAKKGFHDTKVQTIADEAGIAVGTIYNYFNSKDEILEYIFEVENHKRIDFLVRLKESDKSYLDRLMSFCDFHITLMRENPSIGKVLVQELLIRCGSQIPSVRKELQSIYAMVKDLLDEAGRNGETRNINTEVAARIILDALRGIVLQTKYEGNDEDFEILKTEIKTFILNAVKNSYYEH